MYPKFQLHFSAMPFRIFPLLITSSTWIWLPYNAGLVKPISHFYNANFYFSALPISLFHNASFILLHSQFHVSTELRIFHCHFPFFSLFSRTVRQYQFDVSALPIVGFFNYGFKFFQCQFHVKLMPISRCHNANFTSTATNFCFL